MKKKATHIQQNTRPHLKPLKAFFQKLMQAKKLAEILRFSQHKKKSKRRLQVSKLHAPCFKFAWHRLKPPARRRNGL